MIELRIDPKRLARSSFECPEIPVRAQDGRGQYLTCDITYLDRASLLAWLRSRGGSNLWAENTVLLLLGHTPEDQSDDQ
jgi:hypothetical protein